MGQGSSHRWSTGVIGGHEQHCQGGEEKWDGREAQALPPAAGTCARRAGIGSKKEAVRGMLSPQDAKTH